MEFNYKSSPLHSKEELKNLWSKSYGLTIQKKPLLPLGTMYFECSFNF